MTTNKPALAPSILTQPTKISKAAGQTAKFHCLVKHLGKTPGLTIHQELRWNFSDGRHIVWRRGYDVLATGHIVINADPRISIEKHNGVNSLVIRDISQQDAGEYVCQVGHCLLWTSAVLEGLEVTRRTIEDILDLCNQTSNFELPVEFWTDLSCYLLCFRSQYLMIFCQSNTLLTS